MQTRTRTISWLGLAFLTLAALALRLALLDAQSLWYDEGVTAEIARRGLAELTRWTADDIQPPLYYYVVAGWGRMAGWSEWSLRFPSVFFGVLTVPLLAAVTIALTRRRLAGLLAASLAAFHPLLLYYSQEARMYAMLTALGVVLGYLIIHGEAAIRHRARYWTAYVVVATAAIYTHYFAFFLLMALALAYLIDQLFILPRRKGPVQPADADADLPSTIRRRPILGFVLANLVVLGLYIPWITALLTRLRVDASYWDGQLKIGEAIRHVAISFTSGETVLEEVATRLLIPYGILTLISAAALLFRRAGQQRTILYAFLWLAFPVSAVLLLASLTPKFNARYVMIALPGLLLLWSAGLTALIKLRGWDWGSALRTPFVRLATGLSLFVVVLLHTGFAYADSNWYFDPAFTKSEWRELSRYVRSQIQAGTPTPNDVVNATANTTNGSTGDDLIILVSGHAWPVWNYYAPDLPPLRLPDLEILDVNAVLDFKNSAGALHDALVGHRNVWLVQWQHEIVDPMQIIPLQLQLAGDEVEVEDDFWQLQLHHYQDVDAGDILVQPTEVSSRSTNFGNQIYLVDHQVTDDGTLLLFWQANPDQVPVSADLHIAGQTFTADGLPFQRIGDRRPAGYDYPTFRWRADQINLGRIPPEQWVGPGALPGRYRVRLGVYDIEGDLTGVDVIGPQGQPLGKHVTLDVDLPTPTEGPDALNTVTYAEIIPDLFLELLLSAEQAEPGQAVAIELHWYAEEEPQDAYDLQLRWRTRRTDEIVGRQVLRLSPRLPTDRWPDDEVLRSLLEIRPPLDLPADDYWLEVGVTAPNSSFVRVPFRVLGSSRIFVPPPVNTPLDVNFADQLHLLGIIEPLQPQVQTQGQVALTLVWQALARMPADYSATVQWLSEDGRVAAQADLALPGGSSNWLPDQVELQTVIINAPDEAGTYRLVAAVYNAGEPGLPRLTTADGRDLIDLGTVTVQP